MSRVCGCGAYSKILHDPIKNEVIKVNSQHSDLLGIRYPVEYDITCRLTHPHLLSAKRITQEGYLVFDYYPYTLWSDKILNLPLPQRELLLEQLLSAVEALHEAGYLHLDIKGDNVLVNEECTHLVLADFGSALFVGGNKGKSSPRERIIDDLKSPELLLAKIKQQELVYTRMCDYWSLGLLCLEVLLDKPFQYRIKTAQEIYNDRRDHLPAMISQVKGEWQIYLQELLAWDVVKRHQPIVLNAESPLREPPLYTLSMECKNIFLAAALKWIDICGTERVEAFFLATDLFHRLTSSQIGIDKNNLFLACYWLALKVIEGVSVDPREIDPNSDIIKDLWKIEITIIQHLNGCLYYPNRFTHARSLQDLLVAWRYLYSREQPEESFSLEEYQGKTNLSLEQYFYYLGYLC